MPGERINGTVLTFFSTASAVGKTLISINMASELAKAGAKVCLVDLDLQFGDVCNYLLLDPSHTIADLQKGIRTQGGECNVASFLCPYEYDGTVFYVLASPKKLEEAYNISEKEIKEIIRRLQTMFEYVIIDTTSMFSVVNLMLLDLSTIVTFLGIVDFIPTIKNMKIGNDTLRSLNYDENKIRLVLNRSDAKSRISMRDVERLLGVPFDFILPNDFRAASKSVKTGVPLVLEDEGTELSKSLRELVSRYTNRVYAGDDSYGTEHSGGSGWFSRLFS